VVTDFSRRQAGLKLKPATALWQMLGEARSLFIRVVAKSR